MPLKTYYFARYIVFIIISLCLFYGCDTSQDSYLSKNQENAITSLANPFYRMLDIAIKLSFIPQEKDIVQDNAYFLATITTQDSQTLWQDALRVPLDKEYSKWQTLENEAKTYQQRQEYHTKRMQSVRDMSFAYGLYVLKISMDFTQELIDSPAGATNFCWEFDLVFGDEKMWYAMGVMGLIVTIEDIYNALAILAHIDDTAMSSAELMQFLSQLYQPSIMETKLWNLS